MPDFSFAHRLRQLHRQLDALRAPAALGGALAVALLLQSCATPSRDTQTSFAPQGGPYQVDIRRTALGIPHVKADDWGSLGYGYGYSQAEDNLCTMAEAFVTYRGERSRYFGPQARPETGATFGQPDNLDADFFFRFVADDAAVARYRDSQTPTMRKLIDGFVDGYNRYAGEVRAGDHAGAHAACRGAAWLTPIARADVYRRLYAANLAGGEARFVAAIATAQPPAAQAAAEPHAAIGQRAETLAATAPLEYVGGQAGIGSNALAFGADATHDGRALLFGNPHWFWTGPDRFYQAQLTIPGQLDVSGVSFLGVPLIVMGFNQNVAWTHTVSSAKRFGVFQLKLVPGAPTRYVYDGHEEAMTPVRLNVQARAADGTLHTVTRTLYRSRFGPLVNLGALSPALGWNAQQAFALRDINADNFRVFENFLDWGQARSLDDFIAIQKRNAAVPWVNTFAIGRGDPRAWYADIGAVPDVSAALAQRCTPPLGHAVAARMPGLPFLDGSRSDCDWQSNAQAAQPGAMPAADLPSLARRDYVGNFNGSYWLTNPAAPLTGFAPVVGETGTAQSLRTRLGHEIAAQQMAQPGRVNPASLMQSVLDSRAMSAVLFKDAVLARVCTPAATAHDADLHEACSVLAAWNDEGSANARGATLWDVYWKQLAAIPAQQLYAVPFDPQQPLTTPAGIAADPATLTAALRKAIATLRAAGLALDAPHDAALYVQRDDARIGLYGGCDAEGYFTAACAMHPFDKEAESMNRNPNGNTYLQVVSFDDHGVLAHTLIASSESDDPASPHYADGVRAYAAQRWLAVPFTEEAITRDTQSRRVLSSPSTQMQ
ncbi:penicillin acylase family protein [Paraburkholderia sp. Ac-20340]|uniref:penicillin acylase family protein n=1 Tax=Paraburkholderia sp. Ac-20340 TaxID=2703888 RepID=UPI00197F2540|nr:penicillin acylase family protein [Paraburkholderia sp. Ac-20340]MBN3858675.1 penicillin acylase family protein [Paraburkholderia sp. Ac-20340]